MESTARGSARWWESAESSDEPRRSISRSLSGFKYEGVRASSSASNRILVVDFLKRAQTGERKSANTRISTLVHLFFSLPVYLATHHVVISL